MSRAKNKKVMSNVAYIPAPKRRRPVAELTGKLTLDFYADGSVMMQTKGNLMAGVERLRTALEHYAKRCDTCGYLLDDHDLSECKNPTNIARAALVMHY